MNYLSITIFGLMFFTLLMMIQSCTNREKIIDKNKLDGYDYRLFQQSVAWELAKAVEDNDHKKIKRILKKDSKIIDFQEPKFGKTLLMMTISNQQYKTFKLLLEEGANVSITNSYFGSTALIEASKNTTVGYVKDLIAYGANINVIAVGKRQNYKGPNNTSLVEACNFGNVEIAKLLIEEGANINFMNEYGHSALSSSLHNKYYDLTIYLLENGADYSKPILHRDTENRDIYIRDLLKENSRPQHQKKIRKILRYLDESNN